jgi:threonyl-tRNA synthetase
LTPSRRGDQTILSSVAGNSRRTEYAEIDKINGKIQRAEQMKVHTMFVIGKRDMEADAVSIRVHGKGDLGAKLRGEAIADILQSIPERRS